MSQTVQLLPLGFGGTLESLWTLLRFGPMAWTRVGKTLFASRTANLKEKIQLVGAIVMASRLCRHARSKDISHLHVHSCANALNVAMFANRISRLKYSMTLHNPVVIHGSNQVQKWRNASFAILVAKSVAVHLKEIAAPPATLRIRFAPMGVDLEQYTRTGPYEPYCDNPRLKIFCCCRLNPSKRVTDLVEAMSILRSNGFDPELRIAGADDVSGHYEQAINDQIKRLDLSKNITLLGSISESDVFNELCQAHVFGLVSTYESLGIAIAEAMAATVPVVATNVGGVPELITDHEHGLLVSPQHPQEIAEAIMRIARDPRFARQLSRNGRKRIEESFHSGISADAIREEIESIQSSHAD